MGLLPDTQNCGLRMRRECRERFPRHRLLRKPPVSDPGMHHGSCVTHVPWCMSGLLTCGGGENVPDIPGACATRNFTYLARGPWNKLREPSSDCGHKGYLRRVSVLVDVSNMKLFIHSRSLGMDKYLHPTLYNGCTYLSMLGLMLNHVCKRDHGSSY